jgi:hypothetical protein
VPYNGGIVAVDDQIRNALDRALNDARAPLESAVRELCNEITKLGIEEHTRNARAEIDELRRSAGASTAELDRVAEGIRMLDDGRSLRQVLDTLTECTAGEVDRAALLLVKGPRLSGWKLVGFGESVPSPSSIDLAVLDAGLPGAAVRRRVTVVSLGAGRDPGETAVLPPPLPPFAQGAGTRDALALPILLGGTVAAVLYADTPSDGPAASNRWPATLDVLVRHASRVLEAMTIRHITGLSRSSGGPPRPAGRDQASRGSAA